MRKKSSYKLVHDAADYYEPLLHARLVRAMKFLRKSVTVEQIAASIRQGRPPIPKEAIKEALKPCANVIRDAFMKGGKIGAERLGHE